MKLPNLDNHSIKSIPALIENSVIEVHENTEFPIPLIAASPLEAVSATCQNLSKVVLPIRGISPISRCFITIADSGEGKAPAKTCIRDSLQRDKFGGAI